MTPATSDYFLVMAFGFVAGVGELISRYRDSPWSAMFRLPGALYLVVNGVSGLAGLWAVYALNLKFGWTDEGTIRWSRVLVAGFSSLALFRSSVFTVRVGEKDVPIGPAAALQAILASLDRSVDRLQAARRHRFVIRLFPGALKYLKRRHEFFVSYCLGLMQNVSAEEQKQVRLQTDGIFRESSLSGREKAILVCLQLLPFIGFDLMESAVEQLKKDCASDNSEGSDAPPVTDITN